MSSMEWGANNLVSDYRSMEQFPIDFERRPRSSGGMDTAIHKVFDDITEKLRLMEQRLLEVVDDRCDEVCCHEPIYDEEASDSTACFSFGPPQAPSPPPSVDFAAVQFSVTPPQSHGEVVHNDEEDSSKPITAEVAPPLQAELEACDKSLSNHIEGVPANCLMKCPGNIDGFTSPVAVYTIDKESSINSVLVTVAFPTIYDKPIFNMEVVFDEKSGCRAAAGSLLALLQASSPSTVTAATATVMDRLIFTLLINSGITTVMYLLPMCICFDWQPWPPPMQFQSKQNGGVLRPAPWASFCYYEVEEQPQLLLHRSACVAIAYFQGTPLTLAAVCGKPIVMRDLLEHHAYTKKISEELGAPLVAPLYVQGITESIMWSCVKLLVVEGADVNSNDTDTLSMAAFAHGLTDYNYMSFLARYAANAHYPQIMLSKHQKCGGVCLCLCLWCALIDGTVQQKIDASYMNSLLERSGSFGWSTIASFCGYLWQKHLSYESHIRHWKLCERNMLKPWDPGNFSFQSCIVVTVATIVAGQQLVHDTEIFTALQEMSIWQNFMAQVKLATMKALWLVNPGQGLFLFFCHRQQVLLLYIQPQLSLAVIWGLDLEGIACYLHVIAAFLDLEGMLICQNSTAQTVKLSIVNALEFQSVESYCITSEISINPYARLLLILRSHHHLAMLHIHWDMTLGTIWWPKLNSRSNVAVVKMPSTCACLHLLLICWLSGCIYWGECTYIQRFRFKTCAATNMKIVVYADTNKVFGVHMGVEAVPEIIQRIAIVVKARLISGIDNINLQSCSRGVVVIWPSPVYGIQELWHLITGCLIGIGCCSSFQWSRRHRLGGKPHFKERGMSG